MIIALVVGITALVGVSALFAERYGAVGVACLAGILIVGLLVVLVLPDTAWNRLTGADTTADDLGVLHEEGVELRKALPWVKDIGDKRELDAYQATIEEWATRVREQLPRRWRGTFLSNTGRTRFSSVEHARASRLRNWMDDRLERLSQIIAAIGGK